MGRPPSWIFASLALLFAALGGLLVRQQREISRLRSAVSSQAAQLAGSQDQMQQLAGRLEAEEQGRAATGQALRRAAAENTRLAEALGLDASDLSFWRSERLRQSAQHYAPELARLNLAPDRRNALLSLLADRTDAMRDAREIALREGISPDSAAMTLAIQSAAADVEGDIRGLIGAAIDGFFPAPAAPAVTVAVYAPPPAAIPVSAEPAAAPNDALPAYGYGYPPAYAPYIPVYVVSNFRRRGLRPAPRFAGPRLEPARPLRAAPPGDGGARNFRAGARPSPSR
ncbi:MAG TPA: hypothetical protein VHC86_00435 [Opitutaceae bacterium]|nr:hypothetical protein [Opitutaceae bacterium]